jgi:pyruvate dehydrogenase E2 component (dihydrolipoamide acetyltransferase)
MSVVEVVLPELGEGIEEGEFIQWLVEPGARVDVDDPIAEIMTDKATMQLPSPNAGSIKELKAKPGDVVSVGQVLASIDESSQPQPDQGEQAPEKALPEPEIPQETHQEENTVVLEKPVQQGAISPPVADIKVLATPSVRLMARNRGIDINQIKGTGLAGRVTKEDLVSAQGGAPSLQSPLSAKPAGAREEKRFPMIGLRRKIAQKMQEAKQIVPHFTIMDETEVSHLVHVRKRAKEFFAKSDIKITYLPFVIKALIATLKDYPMVNASIDDETNEVVHKQYYNIGFAADTPDGLLVPVIQDADHKNPRGAGAGNLSSFVKSPIRGS